MKRAGGLRSFDPCFLQAGTNTRVILPLYVFPYRPVCLLCLRRLNLFWLLYCPLDVPLLNLCRIFLRYSTARGQVAERSDSGREDEKGSESSSHTAPSLLGLFCNLEATLASRPFNRHLDGS
jgi:hypothetical protein